MASRKPLPKKLPAADAVSALVTTNATAAATANATAEEATGDTTPAAVEATPGIPTSSVYQQIAEQWLEDFAVLAARIPDLEDPHESTAIYIRTYANVPHEFLQTTVSAVEQNEELQVVRTLETERGRDTLQYNEAFRPVEDAVAAFQRKLHNSMGLRKADVAVQALQTYDVTKGLARTSGKLRTLAGFMRRDLGRSGRPRKKVAKPGAAQAVLTAAPPQLLEAGKP